MGLTLSIVHILSCQFSTFSIISPETISFEEILFGYLCNVHRMIDVPKDIEMRQSQISPWNGARNVFQESKSTSPSENAKRFMFLSKNNIIFNTNHFLSYFFQFIDGEISYIKRYLGFLFWSQKANAKKVQVILKSKFYYSYYDIYQTDY